MQRVNKYWAYLLAANALLTAGSFLTADPESSWITWVLLISTGIVGSYYFFGVGALLCYFLVLLGHATAVVVKQPNFSSFFQAFFYLGTFAALTWHAIKHHKSQSKH